MEITEEVDGPSAIKFRPRYFVTDGGVDTDPIFFENKPDDYLAFCTMDERAKLFLHNFSGKPIHYRPWEKGPPFKRI
jgi:hypothetical protein